MPRNISAKRKYLLALSSELSVVSSHFLVGGRRKPAGGGPDCRAGRAADVEKVVAGVKPAGRRSSAGRRNVTSLAAVMAMTEKGHFGDENDEVKMLCCGERKKEGEEGILAHIRSWPSEAR